jgi:hypothetical protein
MHSQSKETDVRKGGKGWQKERGILKKVRTKGNAGVAEAHGNLVHTITTWMLYWHATSTGIPIFGTKTSRSKYASTPSPLQGPQETRPGDLQRTQSPSVLQSGPFLEQISPNELKKLTSCLAKYTVLLGSPFPQTGHRRLN